MRNLNRTIEKATMPKQGLVTSVNSKFIYRFCAALFLLTCSLSANAQLGTGTGTPSNPYVLTDTLKVGYNRQEGQHTLAYPLTNTYGHYSSGADKWIKIIVGQSGYLKLIGGTADYDSIFHLLDASQNLLITADDGTGSGSLQPLINYPVSPGTYYLIVDGSSKSGSSWPASGGVNVYFQLN
jgi:hypothetical protein